MKQNLRETVYWPKIDQQAELHCKTCFGCQLVSRPTIPEQMQRTELPQAAWEYLALDWLGRLNSQHYILTCIDYYSRFIEIEISA